MTQADIWRSAGFGSGHLSNIVNKRQEYVYAEDRNKIAEAFQDDPEAWTELAKAYCADQCTVIGSESLRQYIMEFDAGHNKDKSKTPLSKLKLAPDVMEALTNLGRISEHNDSVRKIILDLSRSFAE